jgi:beta-galactosidase
MEQMNQDYGFMLYRTQLLGPTKGATLLLHGVHDRAIVYINQEPKATVFRNDKSKTIQIGDIPESGLQLDIFVENMG